MITETDWGGEITAPTPTEDDPICMDEACGAVVRTDDTLCSVCYWEWTGVWFPLPF